jgi:hypothetical protein
MPGTSLVAGLGVLRAVAVGGEQRATSNKFFLGFLFFTTGWYTE